MCSGVTGIVCSQAHLNNAYYIYAADFSTCVGGKVRKMKVMNTALYTALCLEYHVSTKRSRPLFSPLLSDKYNYHINTQY